MIAPQVRWKPSRAVFEAMIVSPPSLKTALSVAAPAVLGARCARLGSELNVSSSGLRISKIVISAVSFLRGCAVQPRHRCFASLVPFLSVFAASTARS